MSEIENHVPYETLARAEAQDIINVSLNNVLSGITREHRLAVEELLADAYYSGLEAGFSMSGAEITEPISPIEAYNAGIEEGKREK